MSLDEILTENYYSILPKIFFYVFLFVLKYIALVLIDNFYGTCKKKKKRSANSILNGASLNNNISSSSNKPSASEIRDRITNLKIEKEKFNCPSEYSKAAKIERDITQLTLLLATCDPDDESVIEDKEFSFMNILKGVGFELNSKFYSTLVINIVFYIINIVFVYYSSKDYLLVKQNYFLEYFFNTDEETGYSKISLLFILFGIHLVKEKINNMYSTLKQLFFKLVK